MTFRDFFSPIFRYFQVSEWIRDPAHLQTLVQVFESIIAKHREKETSFGKMQEFLILARNVLNDDSSSPSSFIQKSLQELLQEISNMDEHVMFPMKSFLGSRRQIIGGTFFKRWSSGKMYCFLMKVVSWNGTTNDARSFVHDLGIYTRGISSLDTGIHGAMSGPIFREIIKQIWENQGCMPSNSGAFAAAKVAALTPRGERRSSVTSITPLNSPRSTLASSSSSVGSTPLNSHRSVLASSSSSVDSTPLNSHRSVLASSSSSVDSTSLSSPRDHLCTAPPQPHSLVLAWFMGSTQASFINAMNEACKEISYEHQGLLDLSDIVAIFRRDFRDAIFENHITQAAFFERVSQCKLIQNSLRASPSFRSLKQVAFADEMLQIMFLEALIFSFFQACKKPFQMVNCKIELKPDGDFSISLFPQQLRIAYLAERVPTA